MKYRAIKPFLAFGKAPEVGDIVELTEEQAAALCEAEAIADYEIKVQPVPENKAAGKPSRSVPAGRVSRKRIARKPKSSATK